MTSAREDDAGKARRLVILRTYPGLVASWREACRRDTNATDWARLLAVVPIEDDVVEAVLAIKADQYAYHAASVEPEHFEAAIESMLEVYVNEVLGEEEEEPEQLEFDWGPTFKRRGLCPAYRDHLDDEIPF